jgi:hypothetical protein
MSVFAASRVLAFRSTPPLSHPPLLLLIPTLLAKKTVLYSAARTYGFPKLYRRTLEGIKVLVPESEQYQVRVVIKEGIRNPMSLYAVGTGQLRVLSSFLTDFAGWISRTGNPVANGLPDVMKNLIRKLGGK